MQESFFGCAPLPMTTKSHGYVAHCVCGWFSATERLKRQAMDCLYWHINDSKVVTLAAPDIP